MTSRIRYLLALLLLAVVTSASAEAPAPVAWGADLGPEVFARAAREHRYVLLDLNAVWCHWCHVMDDTTYVDPRVTALMKDHYLGVKADADASPALASRYGDWGWPATIVFAPDGSEIVKRRGYLPPDEMASLLQAIVDDPAPGPSVRQATQVVTSNRTSLGVEQIQRIVKRLDEAYDEVNGGWGSGQKFLDAAAMEVLFTAAEAGDEHAAQRAKQTLDANRRLIDPVWGGVYQYSDEPDWNSPHFEKIMSYQADDLRLYSRAYALWKDPRDLESAREIHRYLREVLRNAQGAFQVSQDADLSKAVTGHQYYALPDEGRRALGIPRVDPHIYARENGWAIAALCAYRDASGDESALQEALRAAQWIRKHRALPGGGFRHDLHDQEGPFLSDTVAMGEAYAALHASTGDAAWLQHSRAALEFIDAHFRAADGGYVTAPPMRSARGVLAQPIRITEENSAVARLAQRLGVTTTAEHAMRWLVASAAQDGNGFLPATLLANRP